MTKRSVTVHDGEYYVDMTKKPHKTIWEAAAVNNKRPLVVKRHACKDSTVFMGC